MWSLWGHIRFTQALHNKGLAELTVQYTLVIEREGLCESAVYLRLELSWAALTWTDWI